jgi:hypothetical protein
VRLARFIGLALALVASAWFALGIRQARDTSRAAAIVSSTAPLSRTQLRRANSLLDAAGTLNPDTQVNLLRAQLDHDQQNYSGARVILEGVVAKEPKNVQAWQSLARSSVGSPQTFFRALRRIRRLVPVVPPPP